MSDAEKQVLILLTLVFFIFHAPAGKVGRDDGER